MCFGLLNSHLHDHPYSYLESLLSELNKTQHNLERKRFRRFLKTRKVADTINGYKQRMNDIKANYIVSIDPCSLRYVSDSDSPKISLMTDARLEMPEMRDIISTKISDAAEASGLRITSTINAQSCRIIDEIHGLREIQRDVREHTSRIFANLQNRKGYYKGEVCYRDPLHAVPLRVSFAVPGPRSRRHLPPRNGAS